MLRLCVCIGMLRGVFYKICMIRFYISITADMINVCVGITTDMIPICVSRTTAMIAFEPEEVSHYHFRWKTPCYNDEIDYLSRNLI
jgi:hypothetical protein